MKKRLWRYDLSGKEDEAIDMFKLHIANSKFLLLSFWLFWKFIYFLKFRKLINFDLNPNGVWYFDLSSFFSGHLEVTDLEAPGEDLIRICCSLQGAG